MIIQRGAGTHEREERGESSLQKFNIFSNMQEKNKSECIKCVAYKKMQNTPMHGRCRFDPGLFASAVACVKTRHQPCLLSVHLSARPSPALGERVGTINQPQTQPFKDNQNPGRRRLFWGPSRPPPPRYGEEGRFQWNKTSH